MKLLLKFLKPYRGRMLTMAFTDFFAAACTLFLPYAMNLIVDEGIPNHDTKMILTYAGIMALLAIVAVGATIVSNKISCECGSYFTMDLKKALFKKVNSLSFEEYQKIGTASFITRQTQDSSMLFDCAANMTYYFINVPTLFIGGCILAFRTDVVLSLIMLASFPIILGLVWIVGRKVAPLWELDEKLFDKLNGLVRDRLSGIRVIRAFDREEKEHERIAVATEKMSSVRVLGNVLGGLVSPVSLFLINFVTVAILFFGAKRMETDSLISAGGIVSCMQYATLMADGILNVSWLLIWLPQMMVGLKRINEVFALKSVELGESGEVEGDLNVQRLTFAYPGGTPVLKDVSLTVKEGQTVAIIGGTGAGKSSLLSVLMGFYDYEGEIYIGDKNYKTLTKSMIRDHYSIALQKSMIFEGTARSNIVIGRKDASDEEMISVAKDAEIAEFIESSEGQYDMRLAGQGTNLSGGQKQRINLARTLLKDAKVYLFDDSFSALDFLTERKVRSALDQRLKGKSRLIVTQRVSTAMHADQIYVLDEGKIVGEGTHESLLSTCPIYLEIVRSQMGGVV